MEDTCAVDRTSPGRVGGRTHWKLLFAIIAVTALLRTPSFFEPHWYNDEGIFAAVAHGILRGERLYADIWDHKPPLIYGVYALVIFAFGDSIPALRLLTSASVAASQVSIFLFARTILRPRLALIAAAIFGILAAIPFLEGTLALTEVFMVVSTTAAMAIYVSSRASRPWTEALSTEHWLTIGLLFGIATAFKPVALADLAALMLFALLYEPSRIRAVASMLVGLATPWFLFGAIFAALEAFSPFLNANLGYQLDYIRDDSWRPNLRPFVTFGPPLVALAYVALNRRRSFRNLLVLWAGFSLAAGVAGGFPFAHYLIQAFPALAVLAAATAGFLHPSRRLIPVIALWLLVVLAVWSYTDSFTTTDFIRTERYYRDFATSIVRQDPDHFYDTFMIGWWRTRDVVGALQRAGAVDQPVLLYGNYAWVYPLADVRPVGRFVMESHVRDDPGRERELMLAIVRDVPAYIVIQDDTTLFPALEALVGQAYRCEDGIPGFLLCWLDLQTKLPLSARAEPGVRTNIALVNHDNNTSVSTV